MRIIILSFCILAVCLLTACKKTSGGKSKSPFEYKLVLAREGEAEVSLVALPEAGLPARFAAAELKHYLDRITGASFPIVEALPEAGGCIILGDSSVTRRMGLDVTTIPRDGFRLLRRGDVIVIAGRDDREFNVQGYADMTDSDNPWRRGWRRTSIPEIGTLFGAYDFLERVAGVRWYFPGATGEFVPQMDGIAVDRLDITDAPAIEFRQAYRYSHRSLIPDHPNDMNDYPEMGITDVDVTYWVLRNRRSTLNLPVNHMPPLHDMTGRFGEEHPEWFAMREDGSRENIVLTNVSRSSYGHLCYSQPGLVSNITADVDAFFSGKPASTRGLQSWNSQVASGDYYSLLPHDYLKTGCNCPDCEKRKNRDGPVFALLSDLIWGYVAKVGKSIKERHPDKILVCLAYNAYRGLPRNVELPGNVLPCPTALHTGDGTGLTAQKEILQEIRDWKAFAGRKVGLWNYSALECLDGKKLRGIPQTEFRAMGRFYRTVKDDVMGVFFENDWALGFQHHMDLYMFHRLTWNPETDVDAVVEEYCRNMYGPAAEEIKRVLERAEEHWTQCIVTTRRSAKVALSGAAYCDIGATDADNIWKNIYSEQEIELLTDCLEKADTKTRGTEFQAPVALFRKRYFEPLAKLRQEYFEMNPDNENK